MTREEERAVEQDCARLIALYANLNDAGAWKEVADLFTTDGRLARPTAPDDWIVGREAILGSFLSRPARTTRHLCTNIVITLVGDDEALGESAMTMFLANDTIKIGSFYDRFVRTQAGWRFAERRGTLTF
jgi:hypothetical protein